MKTNLFSKSLITTLILASGYTQAASYEVKEVPTSDDYRQHFATGLNNNGSIVGIARDSFNTPIYNEDYLTGLSTFANCDISASETESGEYDALSTYCIKVTLAQNTSTFPNYQKIGDVKSFVSDGSTLEMKNLTDLIDPDLGTFTFSNIEQLAAINDNDVAVGYATAPYLPSAFNQTSYVLDSEGYETNEIDELTLVKYWQRANAQRAVSVVNNTTVEIEPQFTEYGGESGANDISNSGYVAGYTSVGIYNVAQEYIDLLIEENELDENGRPNATAADKRCNFALLPLEVCVWNYQLSSSLFEIRPAIWQIDNTGAVVDTKVFDLPFTPNENQTGNYSARALAVNESGVAVGFSTYPYSETNGSPITVPTIFNDEGTSLITKIEDYIGGYAIDINAAGLVIGQVTTLTGLESLTEFFVYNSTSGEFTKPVGFYENSESTASGVNDAGLIVGTGEFEITNNSVRRKHGFLYDSVNGSFTDINDLIACDSGYEIVETAGINNNNQIAATALKLTERKDIFGDVVLDDNGNPTFEEVAVSVVLDPIANGEPSNCTQNQSNYERQGFSTSSMFSLLLMSLVYIRRKFNN